MTEEMITKVREMAMIIRDEVMERRGIEIDLNPLNEAIKSNLDKQIENELVKLTNLKAKYLKGD